MIYTPAFPVWNPLAADSIRIPWTTLPGVFLVIHATIYLHSSVHVPVTISLAMSKTVHLHGFGMGVSVVEGVFVFDDVILVGDDAIIHPRASGGHERT